jgi:inner membrane transporter RhtA
VATSTSGTVVLCGTGNPSPREPFGPVPGLARRALSAVPPPGLVLLSILSIQLGAGLAVQLFPALGPAGTALLRVGLSALLLLALARPPVLAALRAHGALLLGYGTVFGGMNLCFYEAIARIPLGIAVTIEFLGPLAVAVATSRRALDLCWAALALTGVALLSPEIGGGLDPAGLGFAAVAGCGWGTFVLLSKRVGSRLPGASGLAIGMAVAALFLLPFGIAGTGAVLDEPALLLPLGAVALLSTALPFSFEYEALKRLSARTYGILIALEPAVAVMVGTALLGEVLTGRGLLAVGCVIVAAIGVTLLDRDRPRG